MTLLVRYLEYFLVAFVLVCVAAIVLGCATRPAHRAKLWPAGAPTPAASSTTWFWCCAAALDESRDHEGGMVCSDTESTCDEERAALLKWGGYAHVESVGPCEQTEIAP